MHVEQWIVVLALLGGVLFGLAAFFSRARRIHLAVSAAVLLLLFVIRDPHGSMGEDGHRAGPTRYIRRNPTDHPLPDIRGLAVSAVPQKESSLAVQ